MTLPDAPHPQVPAQAEPKATKPCPAKRGTKSDQEQPASGASAAETGAAQEKPGPLLCTPIPVINWYARFVTGPEVKALTPAQKAELAVRNVVDPFNAITIIGEAGISVAADSHSAYGPGMHGWGRDVGVSYTEDATNEFFGTFLIPSIMHQDPHYHRLPNSSIKRRIFHAITQVEWTQGDDGKPMVNYAAVVGFAIDDEIDNLYVPGRETNLRASAERYGVGLATAPIDNFVTEFLPDVARRIHVHVVLIQDIINQVAKTGTTTTAAP